MTKYFALFIFLVLLILPIGAKARTDVNYWYIKSIESEIVVNQDSSLNITENIIADCGVAQKHGIFRVLPTAQYLEGARQESPIELLSITDFDNQPYKFSETRDRFKKTITWKIGDENVLVSGVNNYRISYVVRNALRETDNATELYWNLSGNFWDIPIDRYKAMIRFPQGVSEQNSEINIYSGRYGSDQDFSISRQFTDNILTVSYDKTLEPGEGITLSSVFPKGIVEPYRPTFTEKYGHILYYLIPILILLLCYFLWKKYGRDPKINPTIAPEFEIPGNFSPMELGLIYSDGTLKSQYVSASIINLAVNRFIKIKQIEEKTFMRPADYEISRVGNANPSSPAELKLLNSLFKDSHRITLSSLKNKFYTKLPNIRDKAIKRLIEAKLLISHSKTLYYLFLVTGIVISVGGLVLFAVSTHLALSILISGLIILIFSPLMSKRTKEGHEFYRKIKGFRLFMDKAEKHRQRFIEKENLFEKLLPYAIMFGMTQKWIRQMNDIYGEEYFARYNPVWFYGFNAANFNAQTFAESISSVSSNMAMTISSSPSSSGSGGGGFSGGGGGGGGGGGW